MLIFTATEAKQNFGKLTDSAMTQPVCITRQGRVILEVMTPYDKEQMIAKAVEQALFERFVSEAVQSYEHYQKTGLHANADDVDSWIASLSPEQEGELPVCHN
ncbi:MAG: hypothetical protein Q4D05_08195 [Acinetobacter sp.]|nr:hypothetical protein [Acinetobacter sp.]